MLLVALAAWLLQAAPADAPAPLAVGGKIAEPRKTKDVSPKYPRDAVRAGLAGPVILECTISPKGDVVDARVLRGLPLLSDAAVEAVRKWRYTPTLVDGAAVPVIMTVTVNFKLDGVEVRDLIASLAHENEAIRAVAASNLGWLGKSRLAGSAAMRDAVAALEEAASNDPSPDVRAVAARSLSRIDGRPLAAQLPGERDAGYPSPLEMTALGGTSRPVAWGAFVDPSGECGVEARGERIEIDVPAGTYDLSSELGRVTAPRVMQFVEGDLMAEVTVDELPRPASEKWGPASQPFRGAGLLLWRDEHHYVRLEAAVHLGLGDGLVRYALFEVRVRGRLVGRRAVPDFRLDDGPTDLRLEVRGGEIVAQARQGRGKWKRVGRTVLEPPTWIALGVAAINSSAAPLRAGFSGFELVPGSILESPEAQANAAEAAPAAPTKDSPPKPLRSVRAAYPREALARKIQGTVLIEAVVDVQGRLVRPRVMESVPGLDEAALAAAVHWRFVPASKDGKPVEAVIRIPMAFQIADEKD